MLRSGNAIRFSTQETDSHHEVGIDVSNVKTQGDLENALEHWAHTISEENPTLLEKIALKMASKKGVKMPPKLAIITPSCEGSDRRS